MICALTDDQQRALRKKVAKDLSVALAGTEPFSIKDYTKSVYDFVETRTNNKELALSYASLVPLYIDQIKAADPSPTREIRTKLKDKGVDFNELEETIIKYANPTEGIASVKKDLGLDEESLVNDIKEINRNLAGDQLSTDFTQEEPEGKEETENPKDELEERRDKSLSSIEFAFSPEQNETVYTATIYKKDGSTQKITSKGENAYIEIKEKIADYYTKEKEGLPTDFKTEGEIIVTDPAEAANFSYTRSSKEFEAAKPTVYADQDQEAIEWRDKNSPNYNKPNPVVAWYFKIKRLVLTKLFSPGTNQDGTNIDIEGYYKRGARLTVMPITKLDRNKVREESKEIRTYRTKDGQSFTKPSIWDTNEPVLVLTDVDGNIIPLNENGAYDPNGTPAYYLLRDIFPSMVQNGKIKPIRPDDMEYARAEARSRQKGISLETALSEIRKELQTIYDIRTAMKTNPDLTIRMNIDGGTFGYANFDYAVRSPLSKLKEAYDREGVSLLFEIPSIDNPSAKQKKGRTYVKTPETGNISILIEKNPIKSVEGLADKLASLFVDDVKVKSGTELKDIDFEDRREYINNYYMARKGELDVLYDPASDQVRVSLSGNTIYTFPKKGVTLTAEEKEQDRIAKESAKERIKQYFNNPRSSDPALADDEVYGYPRINVSDKSINKDFNDVTLSDQNGQTVLSTTVKSYNDFVAQNSYINYPLNGEGKVTNLNAYFAFTPLEEDLEKIYPKKEVKTEAPVVPTPDIAQSDVTSNPIKTGIDSLLDDPEFNKNRDQKDVEDKATKAQIERAVTWYTGLSSKEFEEMENLRKEGKKDNARYKELKKKYDENSHSLAKYIPVQAMFNIINTKNPKSVANWTLQGITLFRGADYSDLYHEAWHGFTQAFLTKEEKKALYKEASKLEGSFTDYKGNRVYFKNADEKQLEEYLAEDFRKWMLSGSKAKLSSPTKRTIFQKILDILKVLFSNATVDEVVQSDRALSTIHDLYEKLRVGNINQYSFSESNVTFTVLDKGMQAVDPANVVKSLGYEDSRYLVDAVDALLSKAVDKLNTAKSTYKWTSTLLTKEKGLVAAYEEVLNNLVDIRNGLQTRYEKLEAGPIKDNLQKEINRLTWAIDNFGDVKNLVNNRPKKGDFPKGLIGYHMLKSKVIEGTVREDFFEGDLFTEEELISSTGREGYGKSGNEVSQLELASDEVIFVLKSLHKLDERGNIQYTPESLTSVEKDGVKQVIGIPQLEDFDKVWNVLTKMLQGTLDAETMYKKMIAFGDTHPQFPMKQLLAKLGPVNTRGDKEFKLWTQFYQTFNKSNIPLLLTNVEITTLSNNKSLAFEKWKFEIRPGEAGAPHNRVATAWDTEFANKTTEYIKPDAFGIHTLDIEKVIRNFSTPNTATYSTPEMIPGSQLEFLRAIGYNLDQDNPDIEEPIRNGTINVSYFWKALYQIRNRNRDAETEPIKITSIKDIKKGYPAVLNDQGRVKHYEIKDEGSTYNAILKLQARYSETMGSFMSTNAEGNTQFEQSLNNYLSITVNAINDAPTYQQLISLPWMNYLSIRRNPNAKASIWLNSIFDMRETNEDGSVNTNFGNKRYQKGAPVKINLQNLSGVAIKLDESYDDNLGTASASADAATKLIMDFHQVLVKGAPELMRHADKGSSFSVYLNQLLVPGQKANNTYVSTIDFALSDVPGVSKGERKLVDNILLPYLNAELSRIRTSRAYQKAIDQDPTTVTNQDFNYIKKGQAFFQFADVLKDKTKLRLIREVKGDLMQFFNSGTNEAISLRKQVEADMIEYFNKETNRVSEMFEKVKKRDGKPIISDNLFAKVKGDARSFSSIKDMTDDMAKETLMKSFVVNSWVHNMESISLIYGDLAQYNMAKEEFHKRNAGAGSTGTLYRTDKAALDYVNNVLGRKYYEKYKDTKFANVVNQPFDGRLNTAIVADNEIPSGYANQIIEDLIAAEMSINNNDKEKAERKILGYDSKTGAKGTIDKPLKGSPAKAYKEMNEGDAQGWISFDSYRMLLSLEGSWTDNQELLYNKLINQEPVSAADIAQTFPPQKLQYFGPLDTTGLPITAFHKFSLAPLIPSVIKDKNLLDLHDKMVSENIDYVVFNSGSKVGNITKNGEYDKFYESKTDRRISKEPFTKNTIFANFLKNQLYIAPKYKGKVIFSTQMRKLIEEGLVEGGVPTDFEMQLPLDERIQAWKAASPERKNQSKKYRLYKEYEKNIRALTEYKMQELLDEMNWKIVNDEPQGNLKDLLEFVRKEMTRQDMAEHEIDFLDLGYGGDTLKNDLSLSLSAEKIEKVLNAIVTRRLIKQKVNGESLIQVANSGYENKDSTGRDYSNPTEEDLEKYGTDDLPFYRRGKDGTKAMKVKIALQGKFKLLLDLKDKEGRRIGSIERLNALLKDDEWLDTNDNRRMITMVGCRIPVQGLNSMEFMEVYEFLPEEAGNIIVPPSEIVAKSGGDFDIDKLTVMMPNIARIPKIGVTLSKQLSNKERNDIYETYKKAVTDEEFLKEVGEFRKTKSVKAAAANQILQDSFGNALFRLFGEDSFDMDEEFVSLLTEEGKLLSKEEFEKKYFGSKAIENDLILNMKDILSLSDNYATLVMPNGTDLVKPIADSLAEDVVEYNPKERLFKDDTLTKADLEELKEDKASISGTRVLEVGYNLYKHQSNSIGKDVLGLLAVGNTYNTLFNRIGAYLNPTASLSINKGRDILEVRQTLLMPHNIRNINGKSAISLSNIYNIDNQRIADVLSQLINGAVDVAKDTWLFNIQGNKEVAPVLELMIEAGVPLETAIYFASLPRVREYVEAQRAAKSSFGILTGEAASNPMFFRNEARKKILTDIAIQNLDIDLDLESVQYNNKQAFYNAAKKATDKAFAEEGGYVSKDKLLDIIQIASGKKAGPVTQEEIDKNKTYEDAAFMHFLEIEDMAKATRDFKMRTNFDTGKSANVFDALNKTAMLEEMRSNGRLPEFMVDEILENSPIGSFYIQKFQVKVWDKLFPLRNNEVFNDWLLDLMRDKGFMGNVEDTFQDTEQFSAALRNDFVSFIFQNTLKSFDINNLKYYKGLETATGESSELVQRQAVNLLRIGAFVKDGKLYIDKDTISRHYRGKLYTKDTYWNDGGLAVIKDGTFDSEEEYAHFVVEREYLRGLYKNVSNLKGRPDFEWKRHDLTKNLAQLQEETTEQFMERVDKMAFEEFIRDMALSNIFNKTKMFVGEETYADTLVKIKQLYPELLDKYSVLKKLVPHSVLVNNTPYTNIKIVDPLDNADSINLYYENMLELMDPTVLKVPNAKANQMISEFFSKMPVVGFLQSGLNTKSMFSINRILPQDSFLRMMEKPVKDYIDNMNPLLLDVYYEKFLEQNSSKRYKLRNRTKDYYVPGLNVKTSKALYRANAKEYAPNPNSPAQINTVKDLVVEPEGSAAKYMAGQLTPEAVRLLTADNDYAFVFNDAFEARAVGNTILDRMFKEYGNAANTVGIPSYRLYSIQSSTAIKDSDLDSPDPNKNMRSKIDEAIRNLEEQVAAGKKLVFSNLGYGQEWMGRSIPGTPALPDSVKQIMAPQTFLYLSEQLYRKFGYVNPGYQFTDQGRVVIQEAQEITDDQVREYMSYCYR